MAKLRDVLSSSHLAFRNVQTLLQTGNIIFECTEKTDSETLAKKIRSEIESEFGVQTAVMLRTEEDLKIALKNCPFDTEEGGGMSAVKKHEEETTFCHKRAAKQK